MLTLSAQWIVPIAGAPIHDGFVTIDSSGRIQEIGTGQPEGATVLGHVAILPALVNAHTHLELSFLHGCVPPSERFNDWVTTMMGVRRTRAPEPTGAPVLDAARAAIAAVRGTGTGLVGDVSNTLATVGLLREAAMPAQVFYEQIGFNVMDVPGKVRQARATAEAIGIDGEGVRVSLAPHAPYSVSPALFREIRRDVDDHSHPVTTVHLGESEQEVEFIRSGTGPARVMLETLGVWTEAWKPAGVSPVDYLCDLGFIDRRTLVVHGVQFTSNDLARLERAGATLVSCPRSNVYVGAGSPPLESFYDSGVNVAFGTDSLASVADLNMFNELAEARRIAPRVPARRLLESATIAGARALGFDDEYGSLEAGKRGAFVIVRVPPGGVPDVEEYLVGGVEPDAITWLDMTTPNSQLPTPK